MIYVFLVDTSVSMNSLFSDKLSVLEVAKAGIENFFKWELRKPQRKSNKYMLVTYQEVPGCFKSILTEDEKVLLEASRSLKATDMTSAGPAMASIFDYLAAYRMRNRIDPPGVGRYLGGHEATLIFWFTDGFGFNSAAGVEDTINIPGSKLSGLDYAIEPFRWEQRLYTIGLMPESAPVNPHLTAMSDVMGGKFWKISSARHLTKCMENCLGARQRNAQNQDIPPAHPISHIEGVSMIATSHPGNPGPKFTPEMMFIYANATATKYFPIPESYWPDSIVGKEGLRLPRRKAHPTIMVLQRDEHHSIYEGFPVDRFSMEQTGVTQRLLKRRSGTCWPLFVENSHHQPGPGFPFGFLKVSGAGNTVNIYILPYNFPKLFKLLNDAKNYRSGMVPETWTHAFISYMRNIPCYYYQPIRSALSHLKLWHLWPNTLSIPSIVSRISDLGEKTARQANSEYGKLVASIMQTRTTAVLKSTHSATKPDLSYAMSLLNQITQPSNTIESSSNMTLKTSASTSGTHITDNIFDMPKTGMLEILDDALLLLLAPSATQGASGQRLSQREQDTLHTLPISQMGVYAPAMNAMQILRNPLEDEAEAAERERTLFGNPYAKRQHTPPPSSVGRGASVDVLTTSIDEADEEASQFGDGEEGSITAQKVNDQKNGSLQRRRPRPRRRSVSPVAFGSFSDTESNASSSSQVTTSSSGVSIASSSSTLLSRVPRLSKAVMPVILVPQFMKLSWSQIHSGEFDLAKQTQEARGRSMPKLDPPNQSDIHDTLKSKDESTTLVFSSYSDVASPLGHPTLSSDRPYDQIISVLSHPYSNNSDHTESPHAETPIGIYSPEMLIDLTNESDTSSMPGVVVDLTTGTVPTVLASHSENTTSSLTTMFPAIDTVDISPQSSPSSSQELKYKLGSDLSFAFDTDADSSVLWEGLDGLDDFKHPDLDQVDLDEYNPEAPLILHGVGLLDTISNDMDLVNENESDLAYVDSVENMPLELDVSLPASPVKRELEATETTPRKAICIGTNASLPNFEIGAIGSTSSVSVEWDSSLSSWPEIRTYLHRLISRWPKEYNELETCANMDRLANTDVLTDTERRKALVYFHSVAKEFKRHVLAHYVANIIAQGSS
ncbi:hypothetical protein BASA60_003552 [Batrachochytrium salamandrivorans]|nr:hypothetical protein BASA60_003552 [Batrachochytrium salamandrivorans]